MFKMSKKKIIIGLILALVIFTGISFIKTSIPILNNYNNWIVSAFDKVGNVDNIFKTSIEYDVTGIYWTENEFKVYLEVKPTDSYDEIESYWVALLSKDGFCHDISERLVWKIDEIKSRDYREYEKQLTKITLKTSVKDIVAHKVISEYTKFLDEANSKYWESLTSGDREGLLKSYDDASGSFDELYKIFKREFNVKILNEFEKDELMSKVIYQ